MTKIKSKLDEIDFSAFNLRDAYITSYPEYAAALRDEALFSNYGIKALIKTPKYENNVDEYSNFVDDEWLITTESVVPKFEQYRQNVSAEGMSADGTEGLYPLEVLNTVHSLAKIFSYELYSVNIILEFLGRCNFVGISTSKGYKPSVPSADIPSAETF